MKTRSTLRRLRLPLLCAAFGAMVMGQAQAQNVSNWQSNASGNWSTPGNWDAPPQAAGGAGTILNFLAGTSGTTITSTQDFGGGAYPLSQIYLSQTPADLLFQTPPGFGPTADYTITGGPISFVSGMIYNPDPLAFGTTPFVTGANISTASTSGRLLINSPVNFATNTSFSILNNNLAGAALFIGGNISGTGNITINTGSPGEIFVLSSRNNTGYSGTFTQGGNGNTFLGAINTLFRGTTVTFGGGINSVTAGTGDATGYGVGEAAYNQQHGNITGGGQYSVGTNNASATVLSGFLNATGNLSGLGGLAGFNANSHFGKVGTGLFLISNLSASYNAQFSVRDGGMFFQGAQAGLVNSLPNSGAISVYSGAQLDLKNNASVFTGGGGQGRLSDTAPVRLAGGILRIDGNASTDVNEVMGEVRLISGQSNIVVNSTGTGLIGFSFAGINAADIARGGQLAVIGTALGAGQSSVSFTSATATNNVLPFGLAQTNYVSNVTALTPTTDPNALLERLPGGGVRVLVTDATDTFVSPTANVLVAGAVISPGGSANSLTLDTASLLNLSGPLAITSGALINRNPTGSITGGSLTTAGRMYLNTASGNLVIGSGITAASFSKGGNGTISLTGPVNLTGTNPVVSINSGTLDIASGVIVPAGGRTILQLSRGATLQGITTIDGTLRGGGTVNSPLVTMTAGSLIGASSLSSDSGTGAAPGALTFNGNLAFTGGAGGGNASRLRFYLSSVFGGQYTQSLINAAGLDLTAASAANPIAVQPHSIALSNVGNGDVYDFNIFDNYSWILVDVQGAGPLTGFSPEKFTIDLSNFSNTGVDPSQFSVSVDVANNNLVLNYAGVPEPMLIGLVAAGLVVAVRRRKA